MGILQCLVLFAMYRRNYLSTVVHRELSKQFEVFYESQAQLFLVLCPVTKKSTELVILGMPFAQKNCFVPINQA